MQSFNPRPSLLPAPRREAGFGVPSRGITVPQRTGYPGAVNQAMHHHFEAGPNVPPKYRGQAASSQLPTPTYANTNAALFGIGSLDQQPQYRSQTYIPGSVSRVPRHDFPFRALLIALIIIAAVGGIYAGVRIFSNPDPVNADVINTGTP